ncbi:MAG: putative toxin-antitoxin system toxin component, PIN family [Candidatus Sericytochromatia bacterium]|nr:putative toxin-antitoxin system toxin component, PIN family [Candidatus Tanganyikabacteria bacterium]
MIVVVDTNVLISGLLNPHGAPGRIVDLLVRGSLRAAYDDRILAEYREVAKRERFGFDPAAIAELLDFLEAEGVRVLAAALACRLPDPADRMFLEVAAEAQAEALITGNLKHFPDSERCGIRVVSPAEFLGAPSA